MYYGFRLGGVRFLALDATTIGALDPAQRAWLHDTLEETPPVRATLAFGHLPFWPVAYQKEHEILEDPEVVELFRTRGVAAYVSGHHHAYFPGFADGMHWIHVGCLGGGPRVLLGTKSRSPRSFALLTIGPDGAISVDAYPAPDFDAPLPRDSLPKGVPSPRGVLRRDDLGRP